MIKPGVKDEKEKIENAIELLRAEMIRIGMTEGLGSQQTLQISKKLDRYITKYQTLHLNYEPPRTNKNGLS
ncbi:aspartyl-phosphate phosphatase Spo0E family protein [Neobacillus vireti]|uniref:aspartyl-phosphate phosphatase Spo0E family protein n=1 Tax=Neobacillus vireti TaxID=220686 RepID=UPI002FFE00CB